MHIIVILIAIAGLGIAAVIFCGLGWASVHSLRHEREAAGAWPWAILGLLAFILLYGVHAYTV
jgi:hypothetical protein